ncbi:MAG TPA: hypothetical protein ENG13_04510 [bacterium]|nr:hypothetical protein [bacterium]HEX68307.1 hypothetical protein [bacterium]
MRNLKFLLLLPVFLLPLLLYSFPAQDVQPLIGDGYTGKVKEVIDKAKDSITVVMFHMRYYPEHPASPSNQLINSLINAKKRGVKVKVILDLSEEERGRYNNLKTGKFLSENGIDVRYDTLTKTTHSKLVIVDKRYVIIGSHNWTYYGLTQNNETSVFIDSSPLAEELLKWVRKEFRWKSGR